MDILGRNYNIIFEIFIDFFADRCNMFRDRGIISPKAMGKGKNE